MRSMVETTIGRNNSCNLKCRITRIKKTRDPIWKKDGTTTAATTLSIEIDASRSTQWSPRQRQGKTNNLLSRYEVGPMEL